jgi:hypothetical protein
MLPHVLCLAGVQALPFKALPVKAALSQSQRRKCCDSQRDMVRASRERDVFWIVRV